MTYLLENCGIVISVLGLLYLSYKTTTNFINTINSMDNDKKDNNPLKYKKEKTS